MSDQSLQLVHEFTYQVACGPPHEVGDGPYGSRQYFEMTSGRVEGPRLQGKTPRSRQRLDAYQPGWLHEDGRPGSDRDGRRGDPLRPLFRSG